MSTLNTTTALLSGDGHSGHVRTDDGRVDLDLRHRSTSTQAVLWLPRS